MSKCWVVEDTKWVMGSLIGMEVCKPLNGSPLGSTFCLKYYLINALAWLLKCIAVLQIFYGDFTMLFFCGALSSFCVGNIADVPLLSGAH